MEDVVLTWINNDAPGRPGISQEVSLPYHSRMKNNFDYPKNFCDHITAYNRLTPLIVINLIVKCVARCNARATNSSANTK